MRREEVVVEDRRGDWRGCWEGWEGEVVVVGGRQIWKERRLGERGGERGARRNKMRY